MTAVIHRPRTTKLKAAVNWVLGWIALGLLNFLRALPRRFMANWAGWAMRRIGPLLREHRVGRENLRAAFPEKSPREIEKILAGVWDNLGRVAVEFAHIDRLIVQRPDREPPFDITYDPLTYDRYEAVRDGQVASLLFAAHVANWEAPALCGPVFELPSAVLFRRMNMPVIGDAIVGMRAKVMGNLVPGGLAAAVRLADEIQAGRHVGMLVDQHFGPGVDVIFFGRRCKANPMLAQLARHLECPIYGMRVVRQPDRHTFALKVTERIEPPRDAEGKIDVQRTMQVITSVIEGWIREYPDQWLWLHRRWR